MRYYTLKDVAMVVPPFKNTLEQIWQEHRSRCVEFDSGEVGFLITPHLAVASKHEAKLGKQCEVQLSDETRSDARCLGETKIFGIGACYVKHTIEVETLRFRSKPCRLDTFIFRLDPANNAIRIAKFVLHDMPYKPRVDYKESSDFLPVFDRHGHFIGVTIGKHDGILVCIDGHEVANIINREEPL